MMMRTMARGRYERDMKRKWSPPKVIWFPWRDEGFARWEKSPWQESSDCTEYISGAVWLKVSHEMLRDRPDLFKRPKLVGGKYERISNR